MLVEDHKIVIMWAKLYVAVRHVGCPKSWNRISKTDHELWKGRAVEDGQPGEKGGAVQLKCQGYGKE
jgi:hypothetical protein